MFPGDPPEHPSIDQPKKKIKRRRKRPRIRRHDISPAQRAFWQWEEHYLTAVNKLIESLAVGRKITAKALVRLASDIADEAASVRDKRRARAGLSN